MTTLVQGRILLIVQAGYFAITGLWPLLHYRSRQAPGMDAEGVEREDLAAVQPACPEPVAPQRVQREVDAAAEEPVVQRRCPLLGPGEQQEVLPSLA